jgi:hypothetical protein
MKAARQFITTMAVTKTDRSGAETIYGPKDDGTCIVEFRTAEGDTLAISIPRTEAAVIRHFQAKMPYGLVVPDVKAD